MICSKYQALLLEKKKARSAQKLAYARRRLREHLESCKFCQKEMRKRK